MQLAQPRAHFSLIQRPISGKIEQSFLLRVQISDRFLYARRHRPGAPLLLIQDQVKLARSGLDKILSHSKRADMPGNSILDVLQWQRGQFTITQRPVPTEVVRVVDAASVTVFAVDELRTCSPVMAMLTGHQPAKVVIVYAVEQPPAPPLSHYVLDSLKEFVRDQRLMSPLIQLPHVRDDAGVVRIDQNLRQLAVRKRLSRAFTESSCGQSLVGQLCLERCDGVLAGCVCFKCPADEVGAFGVEVDAVGLSPIELLAHVQVSEFCAANRPAALRFMHHLELDVFPALAYLDFVEDVGDGFHRVGHVTLTKVLFDGDERDAFFEEVAFGDGGVGEVSEGA